MPISKFLSIENIVMDGYQQTLLGRALADALQELEDEQRESDSMVAALNVDGDRLFVLFDEAMRTELCGVRNSGHETQGCRYTHETLELTGHVVAFNGYMNDWSLQACVMAYNIKLNQRVADLYLPQQHQKERR